MRKGGELERLLYEIERLKAEVARRTTKSYSPQEPFGTQKQFLALDCLEALFGGGAGGGKSSALLMAALQYVNEPGYAALLLRKSYADLSLPGAIMSRSHEWLAGSDAHWNGIDKRWTFPSGATLSFGYLKDAQDKYRYASSEFHFIGFDEVTQFEEQNYSFLFSRLRKKKGSKIPSRMRAATNPGGIGHLWCKKRFIDTGESEGRIFIPSLLGDNPFIDQDEYRKALSQLDSVTRKQLLEGAWVQDNAGMVYRVDESKNIFEQAPVGQWTYILGMDFGINDHTAFTVVGWREYDQTLYVLESFGRSGIIPSASARIVQDLSKKYDFAQIVGDTGGMGKAYTEEMRRRYLLPILPADKQNKLGYISLLNGQLEEGILKVHKHLCKQLVDEWQNLPWADEKQQKEHPGFNNHCADATLYAVRAAYAYLEGEAPAPQPAPGTQEYYDAVERELKERVLRRQEAQQREDWYS